MNSAKVQAYKVAAVRPAPPANLLLMLYDGAINNLAKALKAFDYDDPLQFNLTIHESVTKAQAIVRELNYSLKVEAGGELAQNLVRLYEYFDNRMQEGNIKKNKEIIAEVHTRMSELREAWGQTYENMMDEKATDATPAPQPTPAQPAGVPAGETPSLSLMG